MFIPEQVLARIAEGTKDSSSRAVLFSRKDVLVRAGKNGPEFPRLEEIASLLPAVPLYVGTGAEGTVFCGAELTSFPEILPPGFTRMPSRSLLADSPGDDWDVLCRVRELVFWRKQHRYCGACRTELRESDTDLALFCPECGMRYYPQIAPAVIVAITRCEGREILLAHNRNFEKDVFGLIAGFVESGETVEHAAEREVLEETGIRIRNIRYLSSQTWPFPNSLMLAFTAEYDSGEALPDGHELERLGWFSRDNLPVLPPKGSIARAVIGNLFDL